MNKKKIISATTIIPILYVIIVFMSPYFYAVAVDEALPTASGILPSGKFIGSGDGIHEAEGDVKILEIEDGKSLVKFENFKSTNGQEVTP